MGRAVRFVLAAVLTFAAAGISDASAASSPQGRPLSRLVRDLILAPDSPVLHFELGQAYFRNGAMPQAEKEFGVALNLAKARGKSAGLSERVCLKSYLQSIRTQRSLVSEQKRLIELRQASPEDPEIAMWLVDVHLEKGESDAARAILNFFPQFKRNEEILSKWVGAQTVTLALNAALQEERFNDLATLLEVGGDAHRRGAAEQLLNLSSEFPPALMTAPRRRAVQAAFDLIRSTGGETEQIRSYRRYLAALDLWKSRAEAMQIVQAMRKKFPSLANDPDFLYRLSRVQAESGQVQESLAAVQRAIQIGLDLPEARAHLAELWMRRGMTDAAMEEYASALEGPLPEPDRIRVAQRVESWLAGQALGATVPLDRRRRLLDRLSKSMPRSALAQLAVARLLESSGRIAEGYDRYTAAAKLDGRSREARDGRIRCLIRLERWDDVEFAVRDLNPEETRHLWDRWPVLPVGRRLLAMGDTAVVRKTVQAPGAAPGRSAVEERLALAAELAFADGNMPEVLRLYLLLKQKRPLTGAETQKLVLAQQTHTQTLGGTGSRPPEPTTTPVESSEAPTAADQTDAMLNLAKRRREEGDLTGAVEILMRLEPKSKTACRLLADLHSDLGQWGMAAAWQEKSAETDQDRLRAAWLWFRAGQPEEAARFAPRGSLFADVLDAESGRPGSLAKRNAGLLKKMIGEERAGFFPTSAKSWIRETLDAARRRLESNDLAAALVLCDDVLAESDDPQARYLKGLSYLKLGFYDQAESAFKAVPEVDTWKVAANLRLGQLALIRRNPAEALRYLDHAGPGTDPGELILSWGMALALTKSPQQGEDILRQASKRSDRGKYFLGRFLESQGRAREAMDVYSSLVGGDGATPKIAEPDSPYPVHAQFRLDDLRRRKLDKPTSLR